MRRGLVVTQPKKRAGAALAELQEQLAEIARETARLLVQPKHDSADVEALDIRAETLRARIAAAEPQTRAEPVELRRGFGGPLLSGG
jgi:chaperonin cofactor prefoldin